MPSGSTWSARRSPTPYGAAAEAWDTTAPCRHVPRQGRSGVRVRHHGHPVRVETDARILTVPAGVLLATLG
jgi:hypothetical protein